MGVIGQVHVPAALSPLIEGWVGSRTCPEVLEKKKKYILPKPRIETLAVNNIDLKYIKYHLKKRWDFKAGDNHSY